MAGPIQPHSELVIDFLFSPVLSQLWDVKLCTYCHDVKCCYSWSPGHGTEIEAERHVRGYDHIEHVYILG